MNRVQTLRSSIAGWRPVIGTRQPGELYANWPDRQFGVIDASKNPMDLIAVRFWSILANYNIGDIVVYSGVIYTAIALVTAGPFNPMQWAAVGGGIPEAPLTGLQYGRQSGGWTASVPEAPLNGNLYARQGTGGVGGWAVITTGSGGIPEAPLDGQQYGRQATAGVPGWTVVGPGGPYLLLAGGVMTGAITLPADPTSNLQAATKQYVDSHAGGSGGVNPNLLLNGDMRIWQYGGPQLGGGGLANIYFIDHWFGSGNSVLHRGCQNITPTGGAIAGPTGFPNYLMAYADVGSPYTPVAGDHWQYGQWIEADLVTKLLWGTAGALPVTLQFWAQASVAGQYSVAIMNKTRSRSYAVPYTITTANVWQQFIITIPGDTFSTGTPWITSGNDVGMYVYFCLGAGSNFTGASSVGAGWVAATRLNVTGSVNVVAPNQAFYFTGVKLEAGSTATPFVLGSIEQALSDCQRYFAVSWQPSLGVGTGPTTSSALGAYVGPTADATSKLGVNWTFPATMCNVPIVSLVSPNFTNTAGKAYASVANVDLNASATHVSINSAYLSLSSVSVNARDTILFAANASAEVTPTF